MSGEHRQTGTIMPHIIRDNEYDEMTEACLAAGRAVMAHGSPELQLAMRLLLYTLAREAADRTEAAKEPALLHDGDG